RDARTNGVVEQALQKMDARTLYRETGNQIMPLNTLFQLLATDLTQAKTLLFMPDLFAYTLCGAAVCERTIASTSQMLNPVTAQWSEAVLHTFGIPKELFADSVPSGTIIGSYHGAKVIAVAGHDTQCAVAAMPVTPQDTAHTAFLSCGTWSLFGTELDEPILTEHSNRLALSNELGANGKINYLKNIIGLWLIQESRREWRRQGTDYSYAELERLALEAPALCSFIDPDAPEFTPTGDIPARVRAFCKRTGQPVPQSVGEVMRCIYQSLALKYRYALEQLQQVTGKEFTTLHILGGGTKDKLLCQMTANSCNIPVVAGPVEATALGNIIIQLTALGELADLAAGRELIARTEGLTQYTPWEQEQWNQAYEQYKKIF
ncbi:MAG: FGGY-family carbohydrate kinase, partial [Angelakisella sp.]